MTREIGEASPGKQKGERIGDVWGVLAGSGNGEMGNVRLWINQKFRQTTAVACFTETCGGGGGGGGGGEGEKTREERVIFLDGAVFQ